MRVRGELIVIGLIGMAMSAFGQTVSNITFDGVGDSSVRVIFNVSASFNAMRVRYGGSSCSSGSGGTVQINGTSSASYMLFGMTTDLSGLAPSTLYHVCPEVSSNGGSTWSSGADATFTTSARTQTLPLAPLAVSATFPAQGGTVRNVLPDCSNLQAQINAAAPGDTVSVPPGTVCTGFYTTPMAPDAISFTPANVQTSTSKIAVASASFSENQEVRLSTALPNCLPGMQLYPAGLNCDKSGGWRKGGRYYVHIPDGSHVQLLSAPSGSVAVPGWITFSANAGASTITFNPTWQTPGGFASAASTSSIPANTAVQFVSNGTLPGGLAADTTYYLKSACAASASVACTTQVSLTPDGAAVTLTGTGTGTHTIVDQGLGTMYIAPAPTQTGPWVVITSSGKLPPTGVRIDNTWDSQLFHLKNANPNVATPVFSTGTLAHNWRIRGAIFDTGTNTDYLTSTDPRPYCGGPTTYQDSSFIIFDQVRIQGPGYPNRFGCMNNAANMFVDGFNVGFINSHMDGMDYWHAWYSGLAPTRVSGTQVTATAGVGHGGVFTATTTAMTTINFTGGSATGTADVYFAMDGSMKVLAPTGTTGNCSTTGTTCTLLTSGSPTWPADGNGRRAAVALFTISLSAGSVTTVAAFDSTTASGPPQVIEGCNCIISGNGPGPYIFSNTYMNATGLPMHYDDGGGPLLPRGDYTITRNYFNIPPTEMAGGPSSNGLWYGNRQPIEWKGGQRILLDGNIFNGCFEQINPVGVCSAVTPRSGGYVTDVAMTNNSYLNSTGGTNLLSPIDSFAPVSKPGARQLIANNLFMLNGWTASVPGQNPRGWMAQGGYAMENLNIDHNTVFDNRGGSPALLHWVNYPGGGVSITNNIYFYTGNSPAIQNENIANCGTLADKALMDCAFTAGPGNPSYTFSHNLLVPSWSDTSVPAGFVGAATVQNAFPSPLVNFIPNGTSVAANLSLIEFVSISATGSSTAPDLRLAAASPYLRAAVLGEQIGANMDRLQQAQGIIGQPSATAVGSTTATISAFVPDAGSPCYAGYGLSGDPTGWTWTTADTSSSRQRNIAITGLTSGTQYFYSLGCARTALPPVATFRTK